MSVGNSGFAQSLFQMGCLADPKTPVTPQIWTLGDVFEGAKGAGKLTDTLLKRSLFQIGRVSGVGNECPFALSMLSNDCAHYCWAAFIFWFSVMPICVHQWTVPIMAGRSSLPTSVRSESTDSD